MPEVATLAELNAMIDRWDQEDEARRIRSRPRTIGEYFAAEQPLLVPLPEEPFETGRLFTLRVDRYSQISVRTNRYSVPVRLIGRNVRAMLHASGLVVYDGRDEVARHERLIAKGGTRLELDHYLEALVRKPGALPGATALDQARSAGRFTPSTTPGGTLPSRPTASETAPAHSSRSSSSDGTCRTSTWSPDSPPPSRPER